MKSHAQNIALLLLLCMLSYCSDETSSPSNPNSRLPGNGRYFTLLDETNSEILSCGVGWIYAHDDGSVFAAANGVFVLKDGIVVDHYTQENSALLWDDVRRIDGGGGYVWFMHRYGLSYLHDGKVYRCVKVVDYLSAVRNQERRDYQLTSMAAEDDGGVRFTVQNHGLYRYDPGKDTLSLPEVSLVNHSGSPDYWNLWHANGVTYFVSSLPNRAKSLKGYNTYTSEIFDVSYNPGGCAWDMCSPKDLAFQQDGTIFLPHGSHYRDKTIVTHWKEHRIIARDTIDTVNSITSLDTDADGNLFMLFDGAYINAIWSDGSRMDVETRAEIFQYDFGGKQTQLMLRCGRDGRLYVSSTVGLFISKQPIRP